MGDGIEHVLPLVMLDAAEEPAARHVFARLLLERSGAADIDRLLVHAPCPERQPAEAAFENAHAQFRIAVEQPTADERADKAHRAPGVRRQAPEENILPEVLVPGIIGRVPGEAVVGDRQVKFLGRRPDRAQIGVIGGKILGEKRHHCNRPFGFSPFADLAHRLVDDPGGGDDHALEAGRVLPAEIRHVAVVGTDQADFERRVRQADGAEPGGRNQEMDIGPLVVHVPDAILGLIVLHSRAGHLAAHPSRLAAGERVARRRLAQHPPVILGPDAVIVEFGNAADRALPDGKPVGRQFGEARPEIRVDIPFQHLGSGVDVRIGIINAEPVSHAASPRFGATSP